MKLSKKHVSVVLGALLFTATQVFGATLDCKNIPTHNGKGFASATIIKRPDGSCYAVPRIKATNHKKKFFTVIPPIKPITLPIQIPPIRVDLAPTQ